ncbi:MAG: hypothetical protein FJX77_07680, partial [Armatimonadetes bacterium]|nr:hypothetical protein [Armatimonadota bacterium]
MAATRPSGDQVYDQACRLATHLDPAGLLAWVMHTSQPQFQFSRWLDTRNLPRPRGRNRTNDLVAELVDPQNPNWVALCPLEWQTRA